MPDAVAASAPTGMAQRPSEPHTTGAWRRDVILGGQDGLVNMLGIARGTPRQMMLELSPMW